jgi:hypothetical protein
MSYPSATEKPSSHEKSAVDELVSTQIGVWEFSTLKEIGWNPLVPWVELKSAFALFRRLAFEIYAIAPGLLSLYVISKIWNGIESALLMHLSSRLLQIVSRLTCDQQLYIYDAHGIRSRLG